MAGNAQKVDVRRVFKDRLKHEGRMKEWYKAVKDARQSRQDRGQPTNYGAVVWDAMRLLGYEGPEREREMEAERKRVEGLSKLRAQVKQEQDEIREQQKIETFEEAVRGLPDTASQRVDLDWIRCHPAMARKARMRNNTDPVLITVEDVLCPPHGKAPSKAAVYSLQHWANYPIEFFKSLLGEQKKQTESEKEDLDAVDGSLDEVYEIMKQVMNGQYTGERRRRESSPNGPVEVDPGVETGDGGDPAILSLGPEGLQVEQA